MKRRSGNEPSLLSRTATAGLRAAPAVAAVLLLAAPGRAQTIPLSSCAVVPAGATAVLTANVTCGAHCSNDPSKACDKRFPDKTCGSRSATCIPDPMRLGNGAQLRLGGHTIGAGYLGVAIACENGTSARGSCTVLGPGSISSVLGGKGAARGIGLLGGSSDVSLRNLRVEGTDVAAWTAGRLTLSNVDLADPDFNGGNALVSGGAMSLRDVVTSSGRQESLGDVFLDGVEVHSLITAAGNVRGSDVQLMSEGIVGQNIFLRGVRTAAGAGSGSLEALGRMSLTDSDVTGNEPKADLWSGRRPLLVRTRCGKSARTDAPDLSWGVCRDD